MSKFVKINDVHSPLSRVLKFSTCGHVYKGLQYHTIVMTESLHCKNSHVEITHMSVPIVCCLLEHVLKQHLYLISCVIFTQRGQYNTSMHMTGCRFSTPVCCCGT